MIIRKLYHLQKIRNNPWKPKEFLERLQQRKLGFMIKHAYLNVPYYRAMFRQKGLYPEDIKSAKDLRKLPVTTKADLQERWPLFLSAGVQEKDCRVRYTSGSTGNPHKLFFDRNADDYGHATDLRSMYENGYTLRSRMIEMTHPRHIGRPGIPQHIGLHPLKLVSVLETPERLLEMLRRERPLFCKGYPSMFRAMASKLTRPEDLGIRKVFTTSELLSVADRRLINGKFSTDVIDLYGSVEFPRVAWECEKHEGYHMDIDSVILELTKDGERIERGQGNITLTGLDNMAMPLIRYDIGDIGRIDGHDRCSCGRTFPLLNSVRGRCNDRIILPSGREVDPLTLYSVESLMGVKRFLITQERRDSFSVKYTVMPGTVCRAEQSFRKAISAACSPERVKIKVSCVTELPRDPSGKFRAVVSKVR